MSGSCNSKKENYIIIDKYNNKNIDIEKEYFEVKENDKILISNFLNNSYTLEDNRQFIKFKIYKPNEKHAKIIEFEDTNGIKYYHIYINNMILAYLAYNITDYKLKLYLPDPETINILYNKYRLYKTLNNKLYFIIDDAFQYLTIDNENNLITTTDESKALDFIFL